MTKNEKEVIKYRSDDWVDEGHRHGQAALGWAGEIIFDTLSLNPKMTLEKFKERVMNMLIKDAEALHKEFFEDVKNIVKEREEDGD